MTVEKTPFNLHEITIFIR